MHAGYKDRAWTLYHKCYYRLLRAGLKVCERERFIVACSLVLGRSLRNRGAACEDGGALLDKGKPTLTGIGARARDRLVLVLQPEINNGKAW